MMFSKSLISKLLSKAQNIVDFILLSSIKNSIVHVTMLKPNNLMFDFWTVNFLMCSNDILLFPLLEFM